MGAHVTLIGTPPRPTGGEGEVVVDADGLNVIFVWAEHNLIDVRPASRNEFAQKYAKLRMEDSTGGGLMDWCCVQDRGTGAYVCWQVRIDSGCP